MRFNSKYLIKQFVSSWLLMMCLSQAITAIAQSTTSVRFVKAGANGDGSSWANASGDLQAMADAEGVQQVWVAGGRYTPTTYVSFYFAFRRGVKLYGGFSGSETSLAERPGFNPVVGKYSSTTLTLNGSQASVVRYIGEPSSGRLDGFVITGGNGGNGGSGGGISLSSSSSTIANCLITANTASNGGGVNSTASGNPVLLNCVITGNTVTGGGGGLGNGGGLQLFNGNPTLINCLIYGNSAGGTGGGINVGSTGTGNPRLINCTLTANRAPQGAAVAVGNKPINLTDSILWDNQDEANTAIYNPDGTRVILDYCLVRTGVTGFTGSNNLTVTSSPFISATNYQLKSGSAAVNAGDLPTYSALGVPLRDLADRERVQGGRIDLGPFELAPNLTPLLFARPSPTQGNTPFTVVVEVSELNGVSVDGITTLRINKDDRLDLQLNTALSDVNGKPVQNSQWRLDTSSQDYYILITNQAIPAGESLSVGLNGQLRPAGTSGVLTVSGSVTTSKGESSLANNTDSDKVDYFQ